MQRWLLLAAISAVAAGLNGCAVWDRLVEPDVDNPVMGPPPPRDYSQANRKKSQLITADATRKGDAAGDIIPSGGFSATESVPAITPSTVVATINGKPLLAGEILERYARNLKAAKRQASPDEYAKLLEQIVRKDLPSVIERNLLLEALRQNLPKENREKINGFVNSAFDEWVSGEMKKLNLRSRLEFEKFLNKQKTSLAEQKGEFEKIILAQSYLKEKSREKNIGRPELRDYYQKHVDEFRVAARVRWQQIRIGVPESGGQSAAKQKVAEVLAELRRGTDFGAVAKKFSDGPKADANGVWDWTQKNSLKAAKVDAEIWRLPIGQSSDVLELDDAFAIVRPLERENDRIRPFSEVQETIRKKLKEQNKVAAKETVLRELKAKAIVRTIFDGR